MVNNGLFNAKLSLDSPQMSQEDFKNIIYVKLQELLRHEFPNDIRKQKIKVNPDSWIFSCPVCGDSMNGQKHRGNFIFKEGPFYNTFKCFNCGAFMSIQSFFKKFKVDLPVNATDYLLSHKSDPSILYKVQNTDYDNTVFNRDEMEKFKVPVEYLKLRFGLENISLGSKAGNYLYKRCLVDFSNFLYDKQSDSILILNKIDSDNIISLQIRRLSGNGPKYMTVSLKALHNKLLNDFVKVNTELDSLSMLYNLYNIKTNRPVLVTEGPIDSMFLPNCIASLGASKNLPVSLPFWYVYDSDHTGNSEAIDKLKRGYNVFLWERLKKEYNMPQRKKWDINDFIIWCKENNKQKPVLWKKYFSDNIMDIMEI